MSEPGIEFHHVSKKFRRGEMHDSLRDLIPAVARRLAGRARPTGEEAIKQNEFWALQDVSFTVRPGEALGIIGANGAGKSTTLKILTKILRPTRGWYSVNGRIGALIEVAAGFHQDLTGRENVYLQGAIMGMPRSHIEKKFDEIVEFSGISDFIDTPVKRYSSGMNARLGFSIAAHLDPDVLIIDEVLAVGDYEFQSRAFGRIKSLVKSGIPVVIVSHQLDRIAELCTQAMLLERGQVRQMGTAGECITAYLLGGSKGRGGDASGVTIESVSLTPSSTIVNSGDRVTVGFAGEIAAGGLPAGWTLGLRVRSAQTGQVVFATNTMLTKTPLPPAGGPFAIDVSLQMNLPTGPYVIETWAWDMNANRETVAGPAAYVEIKDSVGFHGPNQLNAVMTASAPSLAIAR